MNIHEIQEQLQDNQEITIKLDSRVRELEERKTVVPEIKVPDYTVHFKEIKEMLGQQAQSFNQDLQTELIDNLVSRLAHKLPERTKTVTRHHFDSSAKSLITGGIVLILTTAAAVGIAFTFWRENQRLHDSEMKFRMIKQQYPRTALWADTTYYKNTRLAQEVTERLESEKAFAKSKLK